MGCGVLRRLLVRGLLRWICEVEFICEATELSIRPGQAGRRRKKVSCPSSVLIERRPRI